MRLRTTLLPLAFAACASNGPAGLTASHPRSSEPPTDTKGASIPSSTWGAKARQDVLAAFDHYRDNHPGFVDPENPRFVARLTRARDEGLRLAEKAADREGYADALGAFSAELADGHALAFARDATDASESLNREWPGFIAAFRGDKIIVHHAGATAPAPAGTEIVACDGVTAKEYVRRRLRYRYFRPDEPGAWWARAPRAFSSEPTFVVGRARRCTFGTDDKVLAWSTAPDDFDVLVRRATDGERAPIELREPRNGIFLIGLPDFQLNDDAVKAYHALYAAIDKRHRDLVRARAVVLDLRHNDGGSSVWGRRTAEGLWGKAVVDARMRTYFAGTFISWRASEANLAHVGKIIDVLTHQGNTSAAQQLRVVSDGLRQALADHAPLYVEPDTEAESRHEPAPKTSFRTPVYVITPGRCASACLDAIDVFTRFENVTLIGAPTSADTTYMEVRIEDLPSGAGQLVIPTKVYSHRPRPSGQAYRPSIEFTELDWSTKAFLDQIERDLQTPRRGNGLHVAK